MFGPLPWSFIYKVLLLRATKQKEEEAELHHDILALCHGLVSRQLSTPFFPAWHWNSRSNPTQPWHLFLDGMSSYQGECSGSPLFCVSLFTALPFNDITLSPEIWLHFPSCLIVKQRLPSVSQQCCHQTVLFHRYDNAMNKNFPKCTKGLKQPLQQETNEAAGFK